MYHDKKQHTHLIINTMKKIFFLLFLEIIFLKTVNSQTFGNFTDTRDGKTYKTIKIGEQVWMAENLAFKTDTGCWVYDNDKSNVSKYGYLYNWETARKVCPVNWHLPSQAEFETLLDKYGGSKNWNHENFEALIKGGTSGFSAVLAGWRNYGKKYVFIGNHSYFWSSSAHDTDYPWRLYLYGHFRRAGMGSNLKTMGFSVRCIQDN